MSSVTVIMLYHLGWCSFESCGTSYQTGPLPTLCITFRGLFQSRHYTRNLAYSLTTSSGKKSDWNDLNLNVSSVYVLWLYTGFAEKTNFNSLESRWDLSWGGKKQETHPNVRENNSFSLVGQFHSTSICHWVHTSWFSSKWQKSHLMFIEQLSCAKCFTCI